MKVLISCLAASVCSLVLAGCQESAIFPDFEIKGAAQLEVTCISYQLYCDRLIQKGGAVKKHPVFDSVTVPVSTENLYKLKNIRLCSYRATTPSFAFNLSDETGAVLSFSMDILKNEEGRFLAGDLSLQGPEFKHAYPCKPKDGKILADVMTTIFSTASQHE